LACLVPWLGRLRLSAGGGLDAQMRDPQNEVSTAAAEDAAAAVVTGAGPAQVDSDEIIGATRLYLASLAVTSMLERSTLTDCDWHLYLYDADAERLMPIFEPENGEPSEGWEIGTGATGTAAERVEYVVVQGAETHDGTYGLTPAQQERYRDLEVVAAAPIQSWTGEMIGVLSASSSNPDSKLATPDG